MNVRICCLCPFTHKLLNLYSTFYSKGLLCLGDVRGRNKVCNLDSLQQRVIEIWTGLALAKHTKHFTSMTLVFLSPDFSVLSQNYSKKLPHSQKQSMVGKPSHFVCVLHLKTLWFIELFLLFHSKFLCLFVGFWFSF